MIHLKAKFLSKILVMPDKIGASQMQSCDKQRTDILIQKWRDQKKVGVMFPKQVQNPTEQISLDFIRF